MLILLSVCLLLPNFLPFHLVPNSPKKASWDQFDGIFPDRLQSIAQVLRFTDSTAQAQGTGNDTLQYANLLAKVVRKRFYHGYSSYSVQENWLASVAGATIWYDLSAIVLPDDILKYPFAACSQQSIVMMECFKRKGIDYRKVGFTHHFALEGRIDGQWYFFDTNLEPDFTRIPRKSFRALQQDNSLYAIYQQKLDSAGLNYGLAGVHYGRVNEAPAPRAMLFQLVTGWTSRLLWLLPLAVCFVSYFGKRKGREKTMQAGQVIHIRTHTYSTVEKI